MTILKTPITFGIMRTLHTNQLTMASDRLQLLTADAVVQAAAVTRNVLQTPLRYEEPLTSALCFQTVHDEATQSVHLPIRMFRFCDHYEIRGLCT